VERCYVRYHETGDGGRTMFEGMRPPLEVAANCLDHRLAFGVGGNLLTTTAILDRPGSDKRLTSTTLAPRQPSFRREPVLGSARDDAVDPHARNRRGVEYGKARAIVLKAAISSAS